MGNATFVTDDDKATEWIIKVVSKEKQWRSLYEKPYFTCDFPDYGDSYFKNLWVKKGLQIKYMQWQNHKL
jgi:tRNA G46 methylase TrmB